MVKNTKHAICDKFEELIVNYPSSKYDYTIVIFDCKPTTYEYIYEKIIYHIPFIRVCKHASTNIYQTR